VPRCRPARPRRNRRCRRCPETDRIRRLLASILTTIAPHILREERELFPRIEELDLHPHRVRVGSISQPLLVEFIEHDTIHEWIARVRELGLRVRGCDVDPLLPGAIEDLYRSVHRHLHLENNVLIPRVVDLESRLKESRHAAIAT
jgi:regulator of cell morphogenesis and NO signaling